MRVSIITAADGKKYRTNHYNLDTIISVGYRVKSAVATHFRIWATQKLREYIVKGFVLDDERLKHPDQPFDYFEELMRRFYQKITDIYATILWSHCEAACLGVFPLSRSLRSLVAQKVFSPSHFCQSSL
jgi:hypothetical protein